MLGDGGFDKTELAKLLDELPNDGWVVDEVVSSSEFETTQIVHRDKGLVDNRYVRKVFAKGTGLGVAYRRVLEAQAANRHFEHLPLVYDMVETDEGVAVVTEFVQGPTLRQFVKTRGCGVETALFAGGQLCDAMCELHEAFDEPIVHRDLKPSNIVVTGGKLVLIDLGIARTWHPEGTRDTVLFGTPGYAPPEQFGYGQTTPQSDIYAAGMVVAFCLLGEDPTSTLRESGFADARIPQPFQLVIAKATALDQKQRYASAHEMKTALEQAARAASVMKAEAKAPGNVVSLQGVQESHDAQVHHATFGLPAAVGIVWNVLLAIAWAFLTLVSLTASFTGGTEFLDRMPVGFRLFEYLALVIVPSGLLAVLLCDKRRLKKHVPILGRYTWLQLALRCLGIVAILYFVAVVLYLPLYGS